MKYCVCNANVSSGVYWDAATQMMGTEAASPGSIWPISEHSQINLKPMEVNDGLYLLGQLWVRRFIKWERIDELVISICKYETSSLEEMSYKNLSKLSKYRLLLICLVSPSSRSVEVLAAIMEALLWSALAAEDAQVATPDHDIVLIKSFASISILLNNRGLIWCRYNWFGWLFFTLWSPFLLTKVRVRWCPWASSILRVMVDPSSVELPSVPPSTVLSPVNTSAPESISVSGTGTLRSSTASLRYPSICPTASRIILVFPQSVSPITIAHRLFFKAAMRFSHELLTSSFSLKSLRCNVGSK